MVPKKKEYSFDLRETVIKHFLSGDSEHDIAGEMMIPRNSVHYIITKYKKTKCIENIIGRGRKRKTSMHLDRIIQRKVKVDRRKSASSVKIDIESELGITISGQIVCRRLHEIGLKGRVTPKKPYVNKVNRGKRLEYAKTYREKPLGYWDNVLWTDESKFNLFGSDRKVMVWQTPKEELDPKCTVPTMKYDEGNVKCWGYFSSCGVGNLVFIDGNMTGEVYRDILQKNLFESIKKLNLGREWAMQQDNDPKHRAHIVTHWLKEKEVELLKWPPFSPNLNPVEHMWDEVERRMKKEKLKNETELKQSLLRVWHGIGTDVTKKLVDSVPNRLNEVIRMNGYPTRY